MHNVYKISWMALFTAVLGSCHRQPSQAHLQDIATNLNGNDTPSGAYLYYREDLNVTRTRCPDGHLAVNYNRQNCVDQKQSVPMKPFIETISTGVGATLDQHAKNVQDLYVGIATIDNKLIEFLVASPTVKDRAETIKSELIAVEAEVATKQVLLNDVDKQITAVKESLKTNNSSDLNAQFASLISQRGKLLTEQNQILAAEKSKREQFIAANSSIFNQGTYQNIHIQKQSYNQQLTTEQAAFDTALQEVSNLNMLIALLDDQSFTFNVLATEPAFAGLKPIAKRFQIAFDGLLVIPSTVPSEFTPTAFDFGSPAEITFLQPLPTWVTRIQVEIDGQLSTFSASAKITLPPISSPGSRSVKTFLLNNLGQRSLPSRAQNVSFVPKLPIGWTALSTAGAPPPRSHHSAVVIGSKMIIWGGKGESEHPLNDGSVFDLETGLWKPISLVGAPTARYDHAAVAIGKKMIVWGGIGPNFLANGGIYDLESDSWSPLNPNGAPADERAFQYKAFAIGSKMVLWGLWSRHSQTAFEESIYDLSTNSWSNASVVYHEPFRDQGCNVSNVIAIDSKVINRNYPCNHSVFDLVTSSWVVVDNPVGTPTYPHISPSTVAMGSKIVMFGGEDTFISDSTRKFYDEITIYDLTTRKTSLRLERDAPAPRSSHTAVAIGSKMIIWGGEYVPRFNAPVNRYNNGGIYQFESAQ